MRDKSEITRLLIDFQQGANGAYDQLFPLVYDELRRIANMQLFREHKDITLSKTALVHEVYLKMVDQTQVGFNDRKHFYAIAARCMRQILVDHARKKTAQKRGGDKRDITYIDELMKAHLQAEELIDLDGALSRLAELNPRLAEIVEFRYFGGLTIEDTAEIMDISASTVKRDWAKARGWLYRELKQQS